MSLLSRGNEHVVKISIPDNQNGSCFYLSVLHEENGTDYGVSICIRQKKSALDVSRFIRKAGFLFLESELSLTGEKILLERLDIDKL